MRLEVGRMIRAVIGTKVEGTVVAISPRPNDRVIVKTDKGFMEIQKPRPPVFAVGSIMPMPPLTDGSSFDRGSRVNQRFLNVRPWESGEAL